MPASAPAPFVSHEATRKTVVMATDFQLGRISHVSRLAIAAVAEGFSRREWPNAIVAWMIVIAVVLAVIF